MTIRPALRYSATVALCIATLAGCSAPMGYQSGFAPGASYGSRADEALARSAARVAPPFVRASGSGTGSWMNSDARGRTLLYVSDYSNSVIDVYTYPRLALVGQIASFIENPQGLCTGRNGSWYVANTSGTQILMYAHGGTSPVEAIDDATGYPDACAADRRNGNLAVANICNISPGCLGGGTFLVFKHGVGSPRSYACPYMNRTFFLTYDPNGDIFVDGATPGSPGKFVLGELPRSGDTCEQIKLNGKVSYAGALQWIGTNLLIGDQVKGGPSVVYSYAVDGTHGTMVGSTTLISSSDVLGFLTQNARLIGADYAGARVGLWDFPAGGPMLTSITGFANPIGVTLSK